MATKLIKGKSFDTAAKYIRKAACEGRLAKFRTVAQEAPFSVFS
jgi:hypothetical protein